MPKFTRTGAIIAAIAIGAVGVVAVNVSGNSGGATAADSSTGVDSLRTITVSGEGTASGRPDVAVVSLGVQATGRTATEALNSANTSAAKLLAAVKAQGVADADIATTNVNVYPVNPDGKRVTSYNASNSIEVKVHGVDKAGPVVDAAVAAAGDAAVVQGVGFSFEDDGALQQQARAKAVDSAKTKAQQLAQAAGVDLGRIHAINEAATGGGVVYPSADQASAKSAATPIQPGTQEISQQVTVVYEISG
jgi:uncharacterized protein YggE